MAMDIAFRRSNANLPTRAVENGEDPLHQTFLATTTRVRFTARERRMWNLCPQRFKPHLEGFLIAEGLLESTAFLGQAETSRVAMLSCMRGTYIFRIRQSACTEECKGFFVHSNAVSDVYFKYILSRHVKVIREFEVYWRFHTRRCGFVTRRYVYEVKVFERYGSFILATEVDFEHGLCIVRHDCQIPDVDVYLIIYAKQYGCFIHATELDFEHGLRVVRHDCQIPDVDEYLIIYAKQYGCCIYATELDYDYGLRVVRHDCQIPDVDEYLIIYAKQYGCCIYATELDYDYGLRVVRHDCQIPDVDVYLIIYAKQYGCCIYATELDYDYGLRVVRHDCQIPDVDEYLIIYAKQYRCCIHATEFHYDYGLRVVRHDCQIPDVDEYLIIYAKQYRCCIHATEFHYDNGLRVVRHDCQIPDVDEYLIIYAKQYRCCIHATEFHYDYGLRVVRHDCQIPDVDIYLLFYTKQCGRCRHENVVECRYDYLLYMLPRYFDDIRENAGCKHCMQTCDIRECTDYGDGGDFDVLRNQNISTSLTNDVCDSVVVVSDSSNLIDFAGEYMSGMSPNDMERTIRRYAELIDLCGNDSVVLDDGSAWYEGNADSKTRKACFRLVSNHWIVLGVDPRHKQIFFFDSMGQEPQKYGINLQHEYSLIFSKHILQSKRSNTCGHFCLAFALWLSERPKDIPVNFREFVENLGFGDNVVTNDDVVKRFML